MLRIAPRLAAFCLLAAAPAYGQVTEHEYRPEVIITSPLYRGLFGIQGLLEQHLDASTLEANERIQGLAIVSKTVHGVRASVEVRQVKTPVLVEHRYIPTIYSTIPLGEHFEFRSRTRAEIRDIATVWSHRFQDRTALGRKTDINGVEVFPYMQVDVSYDSRFKTINRIDKTLGIRVPIAKGTSIDTFFTRQDNSRQTPQILYASAALLRIAL